jgi:hypothetical protein
MDAYTHPNWYPLGYISEYFQIPIVCFLHGSADVKRLLPLQNYTLGPSTDAACLNYFITWFIGL